ncbi:MBL fold metallo-hydrolase [Stappia sp. ES.058]|uniref:MBL fold metallo-hydrolase n=1 Tax=Stappia sp. ES.058 TaxID=1881061 RepID=UPI00087DF269|nr:MBL fold metallo-hydrolase [Stappia sp. ES.058]SDT91648.1 L-ascorbate metabolism protein UlaG, beta-lactamase superfamily [Stappia sp. ES.058]
MAVSSRRDTGRHGFRHMLTRLGASALALAGLTGAAQASCQILADAWRAPPPLVQRAALVQPTALARDQVAIRYIGHATFEIETPMGVRIATDYNAIHKPERLPRIVTMNGAHGTHFTMNPDPGIEHVLLGWNPDGGPMDHDLLVDDVRIRNIQTNIRGWNGETRRLGNSIFVFEVADLCIAHLGHLHHRLTQNDLARLGTIDIVFAPVDNASTLRLDSMVEVLEAVSPRLIIPMHAYTYGSLESFTARMVGEGYALTLSDTPLLIASRASLPAETTVLVLPER